jgi:1,4-alpha-glucan branching enzyme
MYADPTNYNYPTMKNTKPNPHKIHGPLPHLVPVRFEFTDPSATTVCVAGTFNQWQADTKTLHSSSTGHWWKETALAPGTYEYCLVVDGQWMPDPLAKESVPNPFGGRNSVLTVADSPEAVHLADAENLPLKNAYEQKRRKGRNKK